MKYRNKRIGLNSALLTHLSYKYRMVYKVTNIKEMQNGPKGQMEERENTCRVQQIIRECRSEP
jgi:hypothetical protein